MFIRGWGIQLTDAWLEAEEGELWQYLHDCDSSAAVSTVSSQQEGSGFESPGGPGAFLCGVCTFSECSFGFCLTVQRQFECIYGKLVNC